MRKPVPVLFFFFFCSIIIQGQTTDFLKQLHKEVEKTLKTNPPKAIRQAREEITIAQKNNYAYEEAVGYLDMGKSFWVLGDYPQSLKFHLKSLEIFERIDSIGGIISSYNDISLIYFEQGDYSKALQNLFKARALNKVYQNKKVETIILVNIGETYLKLGKLDSAGVFTQKAYSSAIETNDTTSKYAILNNLGTIYMQQKKHSLAIEHYKHALDLSQSVKDSRYVTEILINIGDYFLKTNKTDSSFVYLHQAFSISKQMNSGKRIIDAAVLLKNAYKTTKQVDSAYKYLEIILQTKERIASEEKIRQVQNLAFLEEIRQELITEEKEKEKKEQNDLVQYILISVFIIILFSLIILLRKKKIKFRFIEILATVGLLLLFEFIALLTHPWIANITNHTPYLMLVILTLVASILVPLHHYLVSLSKKYLISRQRKKRNK